MIVRETGKETTFLPAIWTNIQESVNKSNVLLHVSNNQTKARRAIVAVHHTGIKIFSKRHSYYLLYNRVIIFLHYTSPTSFTVTVTFAIRLYVHTVHWQLVPYDHRQNHALKPTTDRKCATHGSCVERWVVPYSVEPCMDVCDRMQCIRS